MSTGYAVTTQTFFNICLREMGVNVEGQAASAGQVADALPRLNFMLKRFFTLGMPYYKEYTHNISALVDGTATYSISPDSSGTLGGVYEVYQAYLIRTSDNHKTPLRVIPREEYRAYTNPTSTGQPTAVTIGNDGLSCTLYPTPDAVVAAGYTVELFGYKQQDTFTAGTDTLSLPQEWYEAVMYGMCLRLCGEHGIDPETRSYLASMAQSALDDAVNWSPQHGSIQFGVNRDAD